MRHDQDENHTHDTNGDGLIGPYDHNTPTVASPGDIGAAGISDYHRGVFLPGGAMHTQQTQWSANLDESCELLFGAGAGPCHDEIHVLLNHVETPFFLRQTFADNVHRATPVFFAVNAAFRWPIIPFATRVLFQLERMYLGHHTQSFLGLSATPPTWAHGAFFHNTTIHVGNNTDPQFFDVELCEVATGTRYTYHGALFEWVTNDTEVMAVEHPGAITGEWCNTADPVCNGTC